jgi:uncharacterized membrane protein
MADIDNVVAVRFPEESKAYQALSVLKQLDGEGRLDLRAAAVVKRTADGALRIPDHADNIGLTGTVAGGFIGMFIGILAGPLGMLLGWGGGALIGGALDMDRMEKAEDTLSIFARSIPPGSTAVVASVSEPAVEVIDKAMAELGGEVTRRPLPEVLAEVEAAEDAADAAAKEARKKLFEQRRTELTEELHERMAKLKETLHIS